MQLKHKVVEEFKKQVLEVIGKHIDLKKYKVFVFGSRVDALHKGDDRTDIDIGIEGKEPLPMEKISEIQEDVDELDILYRVEIVDLKSVSRDFYAVAKRHIEPFN